MNSDVPIGSVCSGCGGLDLGIRLAIPAGHFAWVAEYEPPTAKVPNPVQGGARILAHRFPGVPNLGDITVVPWDTTPRAKVVAGGTPCQDVSNAGARRGMRDGTRSGIWSSMVEAITHHRPTLVVWENVLGALSAEADSNVEPCPVCVGDERESHLRALGRVVGDLAEIGYDAVWQVVSASSVGAPHRRERVIVLAWPATDLGDGHRVTRSRRADASDALRAGLAANGAGDVETELAATRSDRVAPLTDSVWGDFTGAIRRWEHALGRVAPAPTAPTARGGMALSPAFVEWMMGLPEGWVTDPAIWTGLSKSAARNAQLKALGNGVVPQQAAAAITWLLQFAPLWVRADLGLSG